MTAGGEENVWQEFTIEHAFAGMTPWLWRHRRRLSTDLSTARKWAAGAAKTMHRPPFSEIGT